MIQRVKPSVRPAFSPLNLSSNPAAVSITVQPGLSVSPAKARQRGRAAKHGTQWHMLCGFLGTGCGTVALLCQASLYCLEPPPTPHLPTHNTLLAVAHQATREAEKVFHWALIEKTPPWIQQMPASCIDAQVAAELLTAATAEAGPLSRGTEPDHRSDRLVLHVIRRLQSKHARTAAQWAEEASLHNHTSGRKGLNNRVNAQPCWKVTWKLIWSQTFMLFWSTF